VGGERGQEDHRCRQGSRNGGQHRRCRRRHGLTQLICRTTTSAAAIDVTPDSEPDRADLVAMARDGGRSDPLIWTPDQVRPRRTAIARIMKDRPMTRLETPRRDRIVSIHQTGNDASERVMQKLGMRLDRETIDPSCNRPTRVYAITRDEYNRTLAMPD
jgi:hypothetical protein